MRAALTAIAALAVLQACNPNIGDSCSNSSECSVTGDRICDVAQPGGYCTVRNCLPDTCPGRSICVEWRGVPDRTAVTYCMDACRRDVDDVRPRGDCRSSYVCLFADDPSLVGPDGAPLARIVDLERGRDQKPFCVADDEPFSGTADPLTAPLDADAGAPAP